MFLSHPGFFTEPSFSSNIIMHDCRLDRKKVFCEPISTMWALEPPGLACLAQSIRALVAFPRDASPTLLPSCWLASRSRQRLHGSPRRPPTVPGLHRPLIGAQCSSTPTVIHPYSGLEVLPVISRRSCSQLRHIPTILSFLFIVGTCISQFTIHP